MLSKDREVLSQGPPYDFIFHLILIIYLFYFWLGWVFTAAYRLSLVVVCGFLIVEASLVAEHRL